MNQDEIYERAFSKENAILVQRIQMIGTTEHGEHIGLEIQTDADKSCVLLVPYQLFQKLILGLMTAGGMAHREQLALLGSDSAVISVNGFSAFYPTGHDVARLRLVSGADVVLVRLKKGALPVIDVTVGVEDAKHMANNILLEAAKPPAARRPSN